MMLNLYVNYVDNDTYGSMNSFSCHSESTLTLKIAVVWVIFINSNIIFMLIQNDFYSELSM